MGKLAMFGKSYNTLGDHNANTCLSTAGDVIIKTPNRYVTIFKNGKLAVENSSEIFVVSSEEEMKKTGVYIVNSSDESGNKQAVYLYVDGTKILLTSDSDGFISYTAVQELKPEQFLLAMKNLGVYFQTLDEAKASGLAEGLVYILEDQKLYKIVNGEFVDILGGTAGNDGENNEGGVGGNSETPTEPEVLTSLQIGGIFIDGESNIISADGGMVIQADGSDYIWFKNGQVFVKTDFIISKQRVFMLDGSQEGISGFMVYTKDDEAFLEIDNLIVHNSSSEYEPQVYSTYVGVSEKNQVKIAKWASAPTDIILTLKYQSTFVEGDYILIQTTGGNKVTVVAKTIELATDIGQEKTVQRIQATLESAPIQNVSLEVTYKYSVNEGEATGTTTVLIPATTVNADTGAAEPNTYGESADIEGIPTIEEIASVRILSGDADIFYNDSGGHTLPAAFIGTVTKANPLTATFPTQDNPAGSILTNLENSPVYKIGSVAGTVNILFHSGNSISLQKCTVADGTLVRNITTQIGDLSTVELPSSVGGGALSGNGIYSDKFIGVDSKFYGGIFEGPEYPKYGDSLGFPADFDNTSYDNVIPCIGWVKALVQKAIEDAKPEPEPEPETPETPAP